MQPWRKIAGPGITEPPHATWSNGLVLGDEVVLSGITARGADGKAIGGNSVQAQTTAILDRIEQLLQAAGGGRQNIYKLVIYLTDMGRKDEVNAARAAFFKPAYPCSTLLGVNALVFPDLLVEIDVYARLSLDLNAA